MHTALKQIGLGTYLRVRNIRVTVDTFENTINWPTSENALLFLTQIVIDALLGLSQDVLRNLTAYFCGLCSIVSTHAIHIAIWTQIFVLKLLSFVLCFIQRYLDPHYLYCIGHMLWDEVYMRLIKWWAHRKTLFFKTSLLWVINMPRSFWFWPNCQRYS